MNGPHLTVATRRSALALAQARAWLRILCGSAPELCVEELHVTTTGDRIVDRALTEIGGKGLFIKEIEQALLDGQADLAVHSMKDVPAELAPGLVIGCIPRREDPRDVAVTRGGVALAELPTGSRVGTSSLRRSVQLRAWRPDLAIVPLRGNVDTRLRKCAQGEVDAVVLARAGLIRLGRAEEATETLDIDLCLPAVGQGALCIERRSDDSATARLLEPLHDCETAMRVASERGVLQAVGGSCQLPVAAHATFDAGELYLRAMLAEPDGSRLRKRETRGPWPKSESDAWAMGTALGAELVRS
ncbi:MAG: hydroxymethylbilane synthase [Polyangiaceae bacterium]|nr:hydroxymethylbilane synthase [Polyangiaceae bacterium]